MTDELGYRWMSGNNEELEAFRACFERNGTRRHLDALRWQYVENPAGELFVRLAFNDDRLGAIYAVQPATARLRGAQTLAAQSVDTLVDASLRGRGLFTKTAAEVYQRVQQAGGAFVYGFPNAHSAPGFFRKLGWVSLDPVPFLIRPLRTRFFVSSVTPLASHLPDVRLPVPPWRLPPGHHLVEPADVDSRVNALWRRFASQIQVAIERDDSYLRWRLSKPGERYRVATVVAGEELVAFCAFTTVDKHGGRIGYVLELLHEPGAHRTAAALLAHCLRQMRDDGADAVLAWCFSHSPNASSYSRVGFLPLPERFRPIELHIGVRTLGDAASDVLADRRSWYISYCDSDTV